MKTKVKKSKDGGRMIRRLDRKIDRRFPMITITKQDVGISELRQREIENIRNLLLDKTLRGFERYNLEIYLASLL